MVLGVVSRDLEEMQNDAGSVQWPWFSFWTVYSTGFFRNELGLGRAGAAGCGHLQSMI